MLPGEKKSSIRTVVEGCAERGVQVSEELASLFYKSCVINPHVNTTRLQKKSWDETDANIVKHCIDRLSAHVDDQAVECVKMQLLLERDYNSREHIVNKVNEDNEKSVEPLLNDILDNGNKITDESSVYYRKTLQYIILINHTGDPTSPARIQETSDAFREVIDRRNGPLSDFENQSASSKKKQLKDAVDLVCGITLSRGNANRRDCKDEMFDVVDSLFHNIDRELDCASKKIAKLTSCILQYYNVDKEFLAPIFAVRTRLAAIRNDQLNAYKTVLVFYHQYEKNLKTIRKDLGECKSELLALLDKYNAKLSETIHRLKNTNDYDETIDLELFDLSSIWRELMEILNYLSVTHNLLMTMMQMANQAIVKGEHVKNMSASEMTLMQSIEEEEQWKIIDTYPLHPMCKWYPASSDTTEKNLFADGYCVVMIVETNGTLIRHDKNLGLIQYCDEWFSFSCIQAALNFGTKPSYYLNCFFNLLRSQTHLLFFFHLYERIAEKQYVSNELMRIRYNSIKYKDAQVQTVTHPYQEISTKKENDIPKIQYVSTQTVDVYKSVQVQTGSIDVGCNTMREKGTNTN